MTMTKCGDKRQRDEDEGEICLYVNEEKYANEDIHLDIDRQRNTTAPCCRAANTRTSWRTVTVTTKKERKPKPVYPR